MQNATLCIKNLQFEAKPTPQYALKEIQHGPLCVGHVVPNVDGQVMLRPEPPPLAPAQLPPAVTTPSHAAQIMAKLKAEQAQETATFNEPEKSMMTMRLVLTGIFIPLCFFIILANTLFDEKVEGWHTRRWVPFSHSGCTAEVIGFGGGFSCGRGAKLARPTKNIGRLSGYGESEGFAQAALEDVDCCLSIFSLPSDGQQASIEFPEACRYSRSRIRISSIDGTECRLIVN